MQPSRDPSLKRLEKNNSLLRGVIVQGYLWKDFNNVERTVMKMLDELLCVAEEVANLASADGMESKDLVRSGLSTSVNAHIK